MSYDNTNRGTLGKNKRREKDTHPEYTGQLNVDGADYWVSGWVKENKSTGEKFFSLSLRRKEQSSPSTNSGQAGNAGGPGDFDDSIPF